MPIKNLAQDFTIHDGATTYNVRGPLPTLAGGGVRFNSLADIINAVTNIIFPLALVVVFVYFVLAGFELASSLGNAEKVKKAQARITNAIVGLALLAMSYWLAQIVTKIFWK